MLNTNTFLLAIVILLASACNSKGNVKNCQIFNCCGSTTQHEGNYTKYGTVPKINPDKWIQFINNNNNNNVFKCNYIRSNEEINLDLVPLNKLYSQFSESIHIQLFDIIKNDEDIKKFLLNYTNKYGKSITKTNKNIKKYLKIKDQESYCIVHNQIIVGLISLNYSKNNFTNLPNSCEISYLLGKEYRRKGIITKSVTKLIDNYIFKKFKTCIIIVDWDSTNDENKNKGSDYVAKKLEFQLYPKECTGWPYQEKQQDMRIYILKQKNI